MSTGIAGPCECPLGKHHAESCPNYIDVWRTCPCPECTDRRDHTVAVMDAWGLCGQTPYDWRALGPCSLVVHPFGTPHSWQS